jgi:hypothetical protein
MSVDHLSENLHGKVAIVTGPAPPAGSVWRSPDN